MIEKIIEIKKTSLEEMASNWTLEGWVGFSQTESGKAKVFQT